MKVFFRSRTRKLGSWRRLVRSEPRAASMRGGGVVCAACPLSCFLCRLPPCTRTLARRAHTHTCTGGPTQKNAHVRAMRTPAHTHVHVRTRLLLKHIPGIPQFGKAGSDASIRILLSTFPPGAVATDKRGLIPLQLLPKGNDLRWTCKSLLQSPPHPGMRTSG